MAAAPTVAVIDHRFADLEIERLALAQVGAEVIDLGGLTVERSLERARHADAILVGPRAQLGPNEMQGLERCRVISRYGVGVDNIDIQAAKARGIVVTNVPDYCIEEVATHAFALLLTLHRKVDEFDSAMRSGDHRAIGSMPRLSSCVLGLVGFGRIGRAVARRATGFGLRVMAYDPRVSASDFDEYGTQPATQQEVIGRADFLSLHVPLNAETWHLLNESTLATMRDGAIIVNVSRGGLIDEDALADRIETGQLGGAGLDVTEIEPLPQGHRLLSLPRVVLTPHIAWMSGEAAIALRRGAAEEVAIVLAGDPPRHPVT